MRKHQHVFNRLDTETSLWTFWVSHATQISDREGEGHYVALGYYHNYQEEIRLPLQNRRKGTVTGVLIDTSLPNSPWKIGDVLT